MAALGDGIKADHRPVLMRYNPPEPAKQAHVEQTLQNHESSRRKNDDVESPQGANGLEQRATPEAASESNDTGEKSNRARNSGIDLNPGASASGSVDTTNSATNVEARNEGQCFECSRRPPQSRLCRALCGHSLCGQCLETKFLWSVENKDRHDPPACCYQEIVLDQRVYQLLPRDLIDRYRNKEKDANTKNERFRICHVAECRRYMRRRTFKFGRWSGECPRCGSVTCAACGEENHDIAREIGPDERQNAEYWKQTRWRTCESCERLLERSSTQCLFVGW